MQAESITGSCLCGSVRFRVTLPTSFCGHCHCSICRRSHGAAFVTWFGVPRSRFEWLAGRDALTRYPSSAHAVRSFCSRCGSSLFSESSRHPDQIEIVLASMQGPIDRTPEAHVYFDDRVSWVSTRDELPRVPGDPAAPGGLE